jgi:hypothetical protein
MIDDRSHSEGAARAGEGNSISGDIGEARRAGSSAAGIDPDATVVASRAADQLQPGDVLGHTYRIVAFLGKGGMGAVYRARHVALDSEHAIKIILSELAGDPKFIALMNQEAKALRSVRNDAIVEYQGFMLDETGRRYLVMEFVDGPSLGAVLAHHRFTPSEVRALRNRLAHGLAAAHEKGVFHRDISPDNIILPGGHIERAKIIDFGIAKASEAGEKTIIGSDFSGKYSFASPEQIGMHGGKVDARSDIYSLGLVLAAAALGHGVRLDMGRSLETILTARQRVPDLRAIPDALRDEIAVMLQPRPDDRPQSMAAVASLGAAVSLVGSGASPTVKARAGAGAKRKSGFALGAGALFLVAIIATVGLYLGLFTSAPAPSPKIGIDQSVSGAGKRAEDKADRASPDREPSIAEAAGVQPTPPDVEPEAVDPSAPPITDAGSGAGQTVEGTDPASPPAVSAMLSKPPWDRAAAEAKIQEVTQGYRCSELTSTLTDERELRLSGFVSTADDLAKLRSAASGLPDLSVVSSTVHVYEWPHCEVVKILGPVAAPGSDAVAPRLQLNSANLIYKSGDALVVRARGTPNYSGYLYVDYFDNEGNVVHMLPTTLRPKNALKPGEEVTLGTTKQGGKAGERIYEISEPFGANLIIAISSPKRLFPDRPQEVENADTYLPVLAGALGSPGAAKGSAPVVTYTFINTTPR